MVDPKQPRSQAFGSAIDVCTNGTVSFQHVATYKSGVSHLHCALSHVHMSTWTYRDLSVLAPLNQSRLLNFSNWNSLEFHPAESRWVFRAVSCASARRGARPWAQSPDPPATRGLAHSGGCARPKRDASWHVVTHLLGLPLRRFAKLNDEIWQSSFQIFKWSWFWVHGIFWTNLLNLLMKWAIWTNHGFLFGFDWCIRLLPCSVTCGFVVKSEQQRCAAGKARAGRKGDPTRCQSMNASSNG